MTSNDTSLDSVLVKRNIKLFTFGIQLNIFQKRLYGENEFYSDSSNLVNIIPIISSIKSSFFSLTQNDVEADLMLGVKTRLMNSDESYKEYEGFFTYKITFKIEKGIKNLKIISLENGDTMRPKDPKRSLKENLVPDINYNFYEDIAEDFLSEFYPEALLSPMPINTTELMNRMSLSLKSGLFDNSIKGLISFKEGYVDTVDEDDCIEVRPGTIVVNSLISDLNHIGVYNNTIIHECVHWWIHKKYMELKMLLDSSVDAIVCPTEKAFENIFDETIKKIEIQARTLAPLILMPRDTSIIKFEELLFKHLQNGGNKLTIYKAALEDFAEYFGVTYSSARNRLEKLGYNESLKKNLNIKVKWRRTTRFLSYWDYCKITEDPRLSDLLEKRLVLYVENFIVPNLPELFNWKGNERRLSDYAKKHINDYAMIFNIEWREQGTENNYFLLHSLYSSGAVDRCMTVPESAYPKLLELFLHAPESEEKRYFFKVFRTNELEFLEERSFSKYLHVVMDRRQVSVGQLVTRSGLSEPLIKKYRSYRGTTYTLDATLRICAALKLYPYEALTLLELQGWNYEDKKAKGIKTTPLDDQYYKLITEYYDAGLRIWNEKLAEQNLPEIKK